ELTGEPDVGAMRARLLTRSLQGRMIDPDEIAQLAVYMASPAAKSLNGQAIALCGGMVMQ
ncbi:MAG: SDR family oxidoreductase, partial [Gammaproteobacteria bacterium]|nr:SDR family oxidoreductase [Gammaproteobacteria bacterium]